MIERRTSRKILRNDLDEHEKRSSCTRIKIEENAQKKKNYSVGFKSVSQDSKRISPAAFRRVCTNLLL